MRPGSLLLLAVTGCSTPTAGTVAPYEDSGLFVRNRSLEIVCEVRVAPAGERSPIDALEPTEIIAPGGSRFFPVAEGTHSIELLDCNSDVMLRRPNVRIGAAGVMLSFEER